MQMLRIPATTVLALALAGCAANIAELNRHPSLHYQAQVSITGQISRIQVVGDQALLEIADALDKRVLVRTPAPVTFVPTDWVKVKGLFVPETKVGQQTVYDAVLADSVEKTKPPMFRNLM